MNISLKNCCSFVVAIVAVVVLFGVGLAQAGWTTLDYPGSSLTQARHIDGDSIVGVYKSAGGGPYRGFLYDGTNWTTLDYPGADSTIPDGIDGDNIVGYYTTSGTYHGFLYDGTNWTTLDYPEAGWTFAFGVDGGNIVGQFTNTSGGNGHGFLYDGTNWTVLDYPGVSTTSTEAWGIDGNNIVGYYYTGTPYHGFVYDGTSWTNLDYPGSSLTRVQSIDGDNIVGAYGSPHHGFLYDGVSWTTLDYPGADGTIPYGIDGGNVVGGYYTGGIWHGFLYELPCWVEQDKLLASDGAAGDWFGYSAAISDSIALIGARRHDGCASDSGAVYLFDVSTGEQLAKLTPSPSDCAPYDHFGRSVALSGNTAVIGAWGKDSATGAVYLFDVATGTQLAKLTASDAAAGDNFGFSAALSGTTAIVGAHGNDDYGSAYLFDVSDPCNPVETYEITASDATAGDNFNFGFAVAISGDLAIVGAHDAYNCRGSAYIFDVSTGSELSQLNLADAEVDDMFGISVAIREGIAIVGAYGDDDRKGSVHVYDVSDPCNPVKLYSLTIPDSLPQDEFGNFVAVSGNTLLVSAPQKSDPILGVYSGAAYLFDLATGDQLAKLVPSDVAPDDRFGPGAALYGRTAIVGSIWDDDRGSKSGSAYVFENVCNAEPIAICQDVTVEADGNCEGNVTAEDVNDGSFDPDGDAITLSLEPAGPYPLGETSVTLTVSDGIESAMCEATITVVDTTPPVIALSVTPDVLWPVNHKMVLITPAWEASDNCDESPEVTLVSITMDEEDDAKGDGHTSDDIQVNDNGIWLRAERSGTGTGRIYTITYQAVDDSGNVTVQSATVTVPHDRR